MNPCAFCGRANDALSRFCIDCGKPINPSAARVSPAITASAAHASGASSRGGDAAAVPATRAGPALVPGGRCPHCGESVDRAHPFCSHCGKRTALVAPVSSESGCASCGNAVTPGVDLFCSRCGTAVAPNAPDRRAASRTQALSAAARTVGPRIAVLDDDGEPTQTYTIDRGEMIVGRAEGDIRFAEDVFLSPIHAQLSAREGKLWVRDLGSRNGTWVFLESPCRLVDGDIVLVGSQLLRFKRLGYPGPHPPEADATRRLGSLTPNADVAVLQQLRSDGSVRDTFHLSPGRHIFVGREQGDWVFPYDQTMSGRHAEVRSDDSEFVACDAGSRNGVAIAVRGERELKAGYRLLVGDQILRVESL